MKFGRSYVLVPRWTVGLGSVLSAVLVLAACSGKPAESSAKSGQAPEAGAAAPVAAPALTVKTVQLQNQQWPLSLRATGNVAAWQEVSVGTELAGSSIADVRAQVGDTVRKGQILATLVPQNVDTQLQQAQAAVAQAQANADQTGNVVRRLTPLVTESFISANQLDAAKSQQQAAQAGLISAQAALAQARHRSTMRNVVAPDDGSISVRQISPGQVVGAGQELFRLIRQNRLEWQAQIPAADSAKVYVGQAVQLLTLDGQTLSGTVSRISPGVDAKTRMATAFVSMDHPGSQVKAGQFLEGQINLGQASGMTLPQTALVLRDGFYYAFVVQADSRVRETRVSLGERIKDHVEILEGLQGTDKVVESGTGFIADGDLVRVVASPASGSKG